MSSQGDETKELVPAGFRIFRGALKGLIFLSYTIPAKAPSKE